MLRSVACLLLVSAATSRLACVTVAIAVIRPDILTYILLTTIALATLFRRRRHTHNLVTGICWRGTHDDHKTS